MISRTVLFVLLLHALMGQVTQQVIKGSIDGIVVRKGTSEPIGDALVLLMRVPLPTAAPETPASSWTVVTESDGKFVFKDLEPGTYRLAFASDGYVRQEFGQKVFPGKGAPFDLAAGQSMKGMIVPLSPTGSVAGIIRDGDGQPVVAVPVQLTRYTFDSTGIRMLRPVASAQTDDRGEYRLYNVTPGRYYLSAGTPLELTTFGIGSNEVRESYTVAFYPGIADIRQATLIDLPSGANLGGIDLKLGRQSLYSVRGRIVDSNTGKVPVNPQIRLNFRNSATGSESDIESRGGEGPRYDNGTFEFRNVLPGSYSISATVIDSAGGTPSRRTGYSPVDVGRPDVEGVVVTIAAGASIRGRVKVDEGNLPSRLGVQLTPSRNALPSGVPSPYAALTPEGTFQIDGVMPGEYRISIGGLPSNWYIKDAQLSGVDILNDPFRFKGSESGEVEIVIGSKVAAIEGVVTGDQLEPIPAAQVVLVPSRYRDRPELFRSLNTDQNGHFIISNIVPGDYKVFAWEALEPYRYFDPDILSQFESKGESVHIPELSKQVVNLKVITAASRP